MKELCSKTNKVTYRTYKDADKQVKLHIKHCRIQSIRYEKMVPYKCEFCHGWHLTSNEIGKRLKTNHKKYFSKSKGKERINYEY